MNFQYPIGSRSVLSGTYIPACYKKDYVDPDWPYKVGMRAVTKSGGQMFEIMLDHQTRRYSHIPADGVPIVGRTPTDILKQMAFRGLMKLGNAMSNWSHLWVTVDDGYTYVLAKDLRHSNCMDNGTALVKGEHHYVPSDSIVVRVD